MKYSTINGVTFCLTTLAVYSYGFNTIKVYDKPIVVKVSNITRDSGNIEISAVLPAHKDNTPIDIPDRYLIDIENISVYGDNFKYKDYTTNFTVYQIDYAGGTLYALIDKYNAVTYHTKPELFKTLKNNMLQNLSILDDI